jgi:hypothetical protein
MQHCNGWRRVDEVIATVNSHQNHSAKWCNICATDRSRRTSSQPPLPKNAPALDQERPTISPHLCPYTSFSEQKGMAKTYNRGDSLMVTHLTTNPPVRCLNRAERTGSLVFNALWSYVEEKVTRDIDKQAHGESNSTRNNVIGLPAIDPPDRFATVPELWPSNRNSLAKECLGPHQQVIGRFIGRSSSPTNAKTPAINVNYSPLHSASWHPWLLAD